MSVKSLDLLIINRALFLKIKEMSLKQERLISGDQIDKFLQLSSKRERLQQEISKNNGSYRKSMQNNPRQGMGGKSGAISMEIAGVIQSIRETDQKIEELIQEKKDQLFFEIKNSRKGQKAIRGYGRPHSKSPRFLDRQS